MDYLNHEYDLNRSIEVGEQGLITEVWKGDDYPTSSYKGDFLVVHVDFNGAGSIFSFRDKASVSKLMQDTGKKVEKDLEGMTVTCLRQIGRAVGLRI